jgi:hypothetical protein
MILLFLYYDNWTDVTTTVVGTEQTMLWYLELAGWTWLTSPHMWTWNGQARSPQPHWCMTQKQLTQLSKLWLEWTIGAITMGSDWGEKVKLYTYILVCSGFQFCSLEGQQFQAHNLRFHNILFHKIFFNPLTLCKTKNFINHDNNFELPFQNFPQCCWFTCTISCAFYC